MCWAQRHFWPGRGRADAPPHRVRFPRYVLLVPRSSPRTVPSAPMPPPKPRRAATCGYFFLGPAPTAEQRLVLIFASAPRKRRRNVGVTNARRARQETGRRMPEYSKSWPRDPAGHTKCTHRSTRSPLWPARSQTTTPCVCRSHRSTRAPRSLTPPSLAAATRRLVVPNALLDTVPKGTRRQGGSGRRSARLAMLLRSCGWSGRVQEAGRMGGGTRTCAKHGRTRSLRRFEFKTFPADRPVCNTSGSGDACGHPHRQGQPRGRRGDAESPAVEGSLRPVVGVASSTAASRRIHSGLGLVARRRRGRDGY